MNKTQKGAWFNLAGTMVVFALVSYAAFRITIHKPSNDGAPERILPYVFIIFFLLYLITGIFFLRRKQSPNEPESDERDKIIKQRAWIASFISTWILFLAASVIPQFFVGLDGSIPVWLLPIVTVSLFYPVLFVYAVAVLIQYGWTGKGDKS
jgi:hypothetical protein